MSRHDVGVIGGGCIGCSVAYHLAQATDLDVCVFEKEYHLAAHQSGRNSGVLHPGFNYPPGSRKARFATEGTRRMKAYAKDRGIPLSEHGLVVVAQTDEEDARLDELAERAAANGVDARRIDSEELTELEPHAHGQAALYAPEAASIDAQAYVYALAADAERAGVEFYRGHRVEAIEPRADGHRIQTSVGGLRVDYLVNAAGLQADRIATQLGVGRGYRVVPFRGEYYEIVPDRSHLCQTMIYPTPDPDLPFLGVHYTRRTDGKVIVGPNAVLALGREAYRNTDVDLADLASTFGHRGFWRLLASRKMLRAAWAELGKSYRKSQFVTAAQRLVPSIRSPDLSRSYAGVRAQLVSADGQLVGEPLFECGPRSLHVLNAVSPGLTSSLPVGEHLAGQVEEALS